MGLFRIGMTTLLTLALLSPVWAQSLGEVAKQEEARRKSVGASGKVYTNGTLRSEPESLPPPPPPAAAPGGTPAAPASGAPAAGASASEPAADGQAGTKTPPAPGAAAKDEATWRKRIDQARTTLAR